MSDEELKARILEYVRNSKKKIGARQIAEGSNWNCAPRRRSSARW